MEEPPPPPPPPPPAAASPGPAHLQENILGQSGSSGSEPVHIVVEERASLGNMSCGNSSLEPEDPEVHQLYLSRRAALHGRKLPGSKPGPALAGDDSCSSAGPSPDRCCDHNKLLVNLKRMIRAHKEKLQAGLEVPRCPPSHFQQRSTLPSGDLLVSPTALCETKSTATLPSCSVPNPVTGYDGSATLTDTSGSNFQGEVRFDVACQLLEEILSTNPEMAAFLEENILGQSGSSGSEPVHTVVEERVLLGNMSCGNSSLEPEDPEVHQLYLSRRAALHRRKLPRESL